MDRLVRFPSVLIEPLAFLSIFFPAPLGIPMRWQVVALLLLAPLFAGCMTAEDNGFVIVSPERGDRFHYRGSDGTLITITVVGTASRNDGFQSTHDVVVLQYDLQPAGLVGKTIPVEESIARTDGSHVRHDVLCDATRREISCNELQEIFYAAFGYAGGLGLAPWWGKTVSPGDPKNSLSHPIADEVTVSHAEGKQTQDSKCVWIGPITNHSAPPVPWMPVTAAETSKLICPGDPLPRIWVPDRPMPAGFSHEDRPVFRLVHKDSVSTVRTPSDSSTPPELARASGGGRLGILTRAETVSRFSSMSAHERALELDEGYASFFRGAEDRIVTYADFRSGGGSKGLAGARDEWSSWVLRIASPGGASYDIEVRRTVRVDPLGTPEISFSSKPPDEMPPALNYPEQGLSAPMIQSTLAYDFGKKLFGVAPDGANHRFQGREIVNGADRFGLHDRYITRLFYVPQGSCAEGGFCVVAPWIVETESRDGMVTYVRLPSDLRMRA
jgi:hypothetical protein